ncbi:MAG: helix-turn-helix domain-containing protein [Actinomycetota bacterium]|nr:helix-turn-helix domain-containing protein [Actinomycetota bacterium]
MPTAADAPDPDRYPGGRLRVPRGVREGGPAWENVHVQLAREALRLLADAGYTGMGVDDVARAAGVSTKTVYRHYGSKVDLAVAGIGQLPTMAGWYDGDDEFENRVARALEIGAAHHEYLVPVLANAIVHRNSVPELLDAVRRLVLEPRQAAVEAAIARGKADGMIRQDLDSLLVSWAIVGQLVDSFTGIRPRATARRQNDEVYTHLLPLIRP